MRTTELVDDVVQQNDLHDDDGSFGGYSDDCDSQAEAPVSYTHLTLPTILRV